MNAERRASWALALLAFALFAPAAAVCGLYLDDFNFTLALDGASPARVWDEFVRYVPGRNLHILFYAALLRLSGSSVPLLHLVSAAFDALLAVLAFRAALRLGAGRVAAIVAAAAFVVAPNHGETHFWLTNLPQCQIPMALTLGALLLATDPKGPRLAAAAAMYAVALFTYEQVFLLWAPILAAAWRADARPKPARYATVAAALAALDAAHLALRYLSPYASGGRPLIRAADLLQRSWDAVRSVAAGLLPWPPRSHAHWGWTVLAALAGLAAAWWLAREARRGGARERARDWREVAAFGLAWTALAYGPNLFWYISPRHNLIPSFGWTLALGAAAVELARRRPAAAPALAATGALAFAFAVVSNAHEATQWIDAARLKRAYAAQVRLLPRPFEAVFLHGAPRRLRRAPAFDLYHDVALAAAREGVLPPPRGDHSPTPTAEGILYFNDLSSHPPDAFHWQPAARAHLIAYDAATRGFACAAALALELPGGGTRRLPLRAAPTCAAEPALALEAALLDSRPGEAPRAGADAPRAGGLALARAELVERDGVSELLFSWRVEGAVPPVLALVPRLRGADGAVVLDAVFTRRAGRGGYPLLWPLVDERAAALGARPGRGLRQRFALRKSPSGRAERVELEVFSLEPGLPARRLGRLEAPIAVRRAS